MATEFETASEECSRFQKCDCSDCPLETKKYYSDKSDPTKKCTLAKSIRKRIGLKWHLKNKGLKSRELKSKQRWDALPESVKEERKERLRKISIIGRLNAKGYKLTRKPKQGPTTLTNSPKTPEMTQGRGK